ncbi:MAG: energy transducer TonB [Pedobacter sp.]|nr:MAG: energy transducer TonB [Pedobacter sp.]
MVINNGSRYLTITVRKHEVVEYKSQTVVVTSKRKNNKPNIKLNLVYSGDWHEPEGLYSEPEYPGGVGKFWSFIKNNIKYPDIAVEKNIEGVVSLEFTIDRTGYLKNVEIIRDIGYGCGQEASKVLKSSKRWNTALQNGRPIERRISIEIPFKLLD